jgi:hypothetical protein
MKRRRLREHKPVTTDEVEKQFDLSINKHRLDDEWLAQPQRMMDVIELAAHEQTRLDRQERELDVVQAEIDARVRANPSHFGLDRVTEAGIKNAVQRSERYAKVYDRWVRLRERVNVLNGAVRAFDQRKKALECLVQLHGQGYFSDPRLPDGRGKEVTRDAVHAKMRHKQHRRDDMDESVLCSL